MSVNALRQYLEFLKNSGIKELYYPPSDKQKKLTELQKQYSTCTKCPLHNSRQKFQDKITVMAMNHVAENEVPDYITELAEAELAEAELAEAQESPFQEEEGAEEEAEETIDDSKKFIEELTGTEDYEEEEEEEEEFYNEDNEDNDES